MPLADRAIGNLQQWLIGTYHGVSRDQLQVYLDESSFATIVEGYPWPRSKPCSASEPGINPRTTNRYAVRPTFLSRPRRADPTRLGLAETTG